LVTGIANPSLILKELQKYTQKIKHLKYGDHHSFTIADIENIKKEYQKLGEYKIILTTEKDFVRLKSFDFMRKNLLLAHKCRNR
jgi:tetraacyldisaccharide 4'-kinase